MPCFCGLILVGMNSMAARDVSASLPGQTLLPENPDYRSSRSFFEVSEAV